MKDCLINGCINAETWGRHFSGSIWANLFGCNVRAVYSQGTESFCESIFS